MTRPLLAVLVLAASATAAGAHSWYDFKCCNEQDCRQTTLGEVERRDNGWHVVPLNVTIPFDDKRIRRSLDPLIHICLRGGGFTNGKANPVTLLCLYIPEMPV